MKFWKNLHYIDYLLFISAFPVFFALPFFMQVYVILLLFFIFVKKRNIKLFYVIGIIILIFSFWGEFNIKGISHFNVYMRILSSLLFMAVLLQRMTKKINFYLKISPVLFLLFSVIFFQNIYMLFYIFFEIFVFLFAYLYAEINNKKEALKWAVKFYVYSIPIVVLLFLFFPRPYMKNIKFGLKSEVVSGFSDTLNTSSKNISLEDIKIAEYKFKTMPKHLYFRGAVLYKRVGNEWKKISKGRDILISYKRKIKYTIKQFPTLKKNIFALNLPLVHRETVLTPFYTLETKKPLKTTFFARLESVEGYVLKPVILPIESLEFNKKYNKMAQKEAEKFLAIKDKNKRLKAIERFFIAQKIVYTLNPKNIDGLNIVDSLFKTKEGYCTHFASAFALFARMAKLPSRIVVGYLGKKKNMLKNFLILKEADAHAWVEVYTDKWVMVDPTKFAYKNEVKTIMKKPNKLSMWINYIRFLIEEWILNYDYLKQQKFLKWLREHKLLFFVIFIGLILILFKSIFKCNIECKLRKKLYKMGYSYDETIYQFLKNKHPDLNELFHKWKFYKVSKEELKELKKLISKL